MNEIKPVSDLIMYVIGIAIALGVAGTLVDATKSVAKDAAKTISDEQMSYRKWNRNLHDPVGAKTGKQFKSD